MFKSWSTYTAINIYVHIVETDLIFLYSTDIKNIL